jgi:hypothetical protein
MMNTWIIHKISKRSDMTDSVSIPDDTRTMTYTMMEDISIIIDTCEKMQTWEESSDDENARLFVD